MMSLAGKNFPTFFTEKKTHLIIIEIGSANDSNTDPWVRAVLSEVWDLAIITPILLVQMQIFSIFVCVGAGRFQS